MAQVELWTMPKKKGESERKSAKRQKRGKVSKFMAREYYKEPIRLEKNTPKESQEVMSGAEQI